MLPSLTIDLLLDHAAKFAKLESAHPEPALYGVTDGKAVGTYFEAKFRMYLSQKYDFVVSNAAKGIDFPDLQIDVKTTSITQPQSSCPYKSARQKIFGLGYSLLVFVYEKTDDAQTQTGILNIQHTIFVDATRTADYQMTLGLRQILANGADEADIVAFLNDRFLLVDDIEAHNIAADLLIQGPPVQGYLTISNALQWRLQYGRVIREAGAIEGISRLL
ncbi:MAG: restriction endonuclease [Armatimonadetes bacterium]|nr:restriction endonuclease [Armatimonadota bacterium]